jgi:hypothetical protein
MFPAYVDWKEQVTYGMRESPRSKIGQLKTALSAAWSPETSSLWTSANPARGQCSVTVLVVQQLNLPATTDEARADTSPQQFETLLGSVVRALSTGAAESGAGVRK